MEKLAVFTPLEEAIAEIKNRRKNPALVAAVRKYLNDDIPAHFNQADPILYLCRHIATPNYEALRFIEIGKKTGLSLVIGEDQEGLFVGNNRLKRALGKLPIVTGLTRYRDEITENCTVIDFSHAQGKPLNQLVTKSGTPLINFHHELFKEIYETGITICDESDWIDRHHRDNLAEQYRHMLALLIVHGIMFESYSPDENRLVEAVLLPAFEDIVQNFGYRPLICELVDANLEQIRDWNSYPSVLYRKIKTHVSEHNRSSPD